MRNFQIVHIFFYSLFLTHLLSSCGQLAAQVAFNSPDVFNYGRALGITVDIFRIDSPMMMKEHDVKFGVLNLVEKDVPHQIDIIIIEELHRVAQTEKLRHLVSQGDLLSSPRQLILRIVAMSTSYREMIYHVVGILLLPHCFHQIIAQKLIFVSTPI